MDKLGKVIKETALKARLDYIEDRLGEIEKVLDSVDGATATNTIRMRVHEREYHEE